jgi:glycosyltransferase involved in cell wall biosynthesis
LVYGFGWVSKLFIVFYNRIRGNKVIFEVNEKPYSIRATGRSDIILKYFAPVNLYFLTRFVYPFVDGFIVISEPLKDFVEKYASKNTKIIKIPIIVDFDYYANYALTDNGLKKPFMIHTATLNDIKDGIIDVFKAFVIVHKKTKIPLHFYLSNRIGLKTVIDTIEKLIRENSLNEYVHFLNQPDDDTIVRYQANATLTVINKADTDQNRHNFATKTGEYLALGIPIITTRIGEIENYLEDDVSCLFINPSSIYEMAAKIEYIIRNESKAKIIGQNGRQIAKMYFDANIQNRVLVDFLYKI